MACGPIPSAISSSLVNGSTNTPVSDKITSENVDELVGKNGPEWFKKNYDAINRAMAN